MLYYAHGDAIVAADEIADNPHLSQQISKFYTDMSSGNEPTALSFDSGQLNSDTAVMAFVPPGDGPQAVAWTPIGLGRPLTIMVREVYTGKYPRGGILGGDGKDMLITSAVKSIAAFGAKPRAHNFLQNKVPAKSRLQRPQASKNGTPYIFHSPALLERSLTMDITIVFDTFPQEVFNQVGDIFNSAAGIPIFQVHSVYLLAAGMLAKLVGQAGESIFDGKPVFDSSDPIDIALAGSAPMPPGFALITTQNVDAIDKNFRKNYHVNDTGKVVDKNGEEYLGDMPYVVISVDGASDENLASFAPTAASAAVLSRFFGIKDGQQLPLDTVIDAIKLYNDLTFRKQIDQIDKKLEGLSATDPQRPALEEKRKALLANILEEILKPKAT